MLLGRRADELADLVEMLDAVLAYNPSVKAGIDMALHDLLARQLGVSLNVLLGGRMRDTIPQARILAIKPPADMARQAALRVEEGFRQLKLKLSGDTEVDAQRVAEVRAAVGSQVVLTLDPNQSYNAKQMMSAFARMERHDIALIEQPVPAADWAGLALLTKTLPVAIEADESAQTVHDVFRLVSERVVDVINLKPTKLGGLRRFMQAAKVCEAGQVEHAWARRSVPPCCRPWGCTQPACSMRFRSDASCRSTSTCSTTPSRRCRRMRARRLYRPRQAAASHGPPIQLERDLRALRSAEPFERQAISQQVVHPALEVLRQQHP